jgi:hypothetical protein
LQPNSSDGFKFKAKGYNWKTIRRPHLGDSSETIGKQLRNHWGTKFGRQLGVVGVKWKITGRESGEHIWNKRRENWETTFARQPRDN